MSGGFYSTSEAWYHAAKGALSQGAKSITSAFDSFEATLEKTLQNTLAPTGWRIASLGGKSSNVYKQLAAGTVSLQCSDDKGTLCSFDWDVVGVSVTKSLPILKFEKLRKIA